MFEIHATSVRNGHYELAYIHFDGETYINNGPITDLSWVAAARAKEFDFYIDAEFVSRELFIDCRYSKVQGLNVVSQKLH